MAWPRPSEAFRTDTSISVQCHFHFQRFQKTIFLRLLSQPLKNDLRPFLTQGWSKIRKQTKLLTSALEARTRVQEKGGTPPPALYIYSHTL